MKILKLFGKLMAFIGVTIGSVLLLLVLTILLICHGPSESAKELFATTILETGQVKFLANWFLSEKEINEILAKNSLAEMKAEVDTKLIDTKNDDNKNDTNKLAINNDDTKNIFLTVLLP